MRYALIMVYGLIAHAFPAGQVCTILKYTVYLHRTGVGPSFCTALSNTRISFFFNESLWELSHDGEQLTFRIFVWFSWRYQRLSKGPWYPLWVHANKVTYRCGFRTSWFIIWHFKPKECIIYTVKSYHQHTAMASMDLFIFVSLLTWSLSAAQGESSLNQLCVFFFCHFQ